MRLKWIDICKGIGIIAVVLGHVIVRLESEGIIKLWAVLICDFIYSFHVPLLFILSGVCFSLAYANGKCLKTDKIRNAIWNNLLLYLNWSLLFLVYKFIFSRFTIEKVRFVDFLNIPVIAQSGLWYIYILIVAYILVASFYRKSTKLLLQAVIFVACILMPFSKGIELETYTIFRVGYVIFFLVGIEYGSLLDYKWQDGARQLLSQNKRILLIVLGSVSIMGLVYEYLYFTNHGFLRGGWSDVPIVGMMQAILFSSFIILMVYMLDKKGCRCSLLEYLGKHSLEIYILHMFIFTPLIKILRKVHFEYECIVIITSIVSLLISVVISQITKK